MARSHRLSAHVDAAPSLGMLVTEVGKGDNSVGAEVDCQMMVCACLFEHIGWIHSAQDILQLRTGREAGIDGIDEKYTAHHARDIVTPLHCRREGCRDLSVEMVGDSCLEVGEELRVL